MTTEEQIAELEAKIAFQEHTIESLNDEVLAQQKQIQELKFTVDHVVAKVKQLSVSNVAHESEETLPPHY